MATQRRSDSFRRFHAVIPGGGTARLARCLLNAACIGRVRVTRGGCKTQQETNMRLLLRFPAVAALAAAWLFLVPAVNAQEQQPPAPAQPPSPGASNPAPNLSDEKLDAAAAAALRVAGIKQEYQQRIAAA